MRDLQLLLNPWLLGLAVFLVPSYIMLAERVWASDEQGHGPIILGVTLWLAWQRREAFQKLPDASASIAGWLLVALGTVAYVVGRSQYVDTLEILAHLPILAGVLMLTKGAKGLKWGAFFLFFLLFMVPLPGVLVQAITTPLKIAVSLAAEYVMAGVGYPIARTGVILYVGQYQLLVADACAGLNSMFTLEALGLLYMNMMNYTSVSRNLTLATLIIPISFCANVIRVIVLVLVTHHFGDEVGQGFVHSFAGMLLFGVALTLMIVVDGLLGRVFDPRGRVVTEQVMS
ncbi:MAG: exosortase B [Burkholderiales bacterium]|nr:exosortase B [Burkholderiales bacterium]